MVATKIKTRVTLSAEGTCPSHSRSDILVGGARRHDRRTTRARWHERGTDADQHGARRPDRLYQRHRSQVRCPPQARYRSSCHHRHLRLRPTRRDARRAGRGAVHEHRADGSRRRRGHPVGTRRARRRGRGLLSSRDAVPPGGYRHRGTLASELNATPSHETPFALREEDTPMNRSRRCKTHALPAAPFAVLSASLVAPASAAETIEATVIDGYPAKAFPTTIPTSTRTRCSACAGISSCATRERQRRAFRSRGTRDPAACKRTTGGSTAISSWRANAEPPRATRPLETRRQADAANRSPRKSPVRV